MGEVERIAELNDRFRWSLDAHNVYLGEVALMSVIAAIRYCDMISGYPFTPAREEGKVSIGGTVYQ